MPKSKLFAMPFSRYICWPIFIGTFLLGLVYAVYGAPIEKIVLVYPSMTKTNALFQDQANQCFKMQSREVKCTSNAETLAPQ